MTEIISLRRKFVNSTLTNKTCKRCNKEYPRTAEFFYLRKERAGNKQKHFDSACIRCDNERSLKWKADNRKELILKNHKYKSSETGYFKELFQSIKKSKHGSGFKDYDEFFNCWIEQQKIYGMKCPYTGVEMTRIKGINKEGFRKKTTETNISKDRILSSKPYSKKNIMFVSWGVNNMKGNISPKVAKQYLQFVKERFGTDEIE